MVKSRRFLVGTCALLTVAAVGGCSSSSKGTSSSPTSSSPTSSSQSSSSPSSSSQSSTGSAAAPPTGAPIKVGLICECSGVYASSSIAQVDVYKAWVNTVNASGGINGHPVDLKVMDDGGVTGTAVSDAQSLISDHVAAIADISVEDSAWASTVQAANIPVVGVQLPSVPFYTNPDFYPNGQTNNSAAYAVVATAKAAGATNLGVIYCAEAPTCSALVSLVKTAGQQLGVPVTYSASIAGTAPNYTAQCVAAQQAHVTALAVFDVAIPNIRLGTDCNRQGYDPIYLTEGYGYSTNQGQAPGLGKNMWSEYSLLPYWDNAPEVQTMNTAVDKYYPGLRNNVNYWQEGAASAWAAGILLDDAVKAGGLNATAAPSASEIVTGLDSLHGDTLDGWSPPLTFTAGQPHPVECWFTAHIQNAVPSLTNNGKLSCQNGSSS
jgi:branched-chain amino acid transport system substrate-binding protein